MSEGAAGVDTAQVLPAQPSARVAPWVYVFIRNKQAFGACIKETYKQEASQWAKCLMLETKTSCSLLCYSLLILTEDTQNLTTQMSPSYWKSH